MNRPLLFLLILLALATTAGAQTLDEWLRQRETQQKYLVQQIAALQAYTGTLRQGYDALGRGISTVQHSKEGDLGLHRVFFYSLRQVNPLLKQTGRVEAVLSWQRAILRDWTSSLRSIRQQGGLSPMELDYLDRVKAQVLRSGARDMEALRLLLTSPKLSLTDAERLRRLEALHRAMQERHQLTRSLLDEARLLALHRAHERYETRVIKTIHGF